MTSMSSATTEEEARNLIPQLEFCVHALAKNYH